MSQNPHLGPANRLKHITDIIEMLNVWNRESLLELSQTLIYNNLAMAPDGEIIAAYQSFVSKTKEMIALTRQAEGDNAGLEEEGTKEGATEDDSAETGQEEEPEA